jgi:chromosome segregation ATPase
MNNEQNEKTMQFILEQQAKLSSDLVQLADSHVQAEKRISRLESAVVTGITLMNDLTTKVNNLTNQVADLTSKFGDLADAQTHTDKRLDALIDAQIRSDKRLDDLIRTVNRYLEGPNGTPRTEG